MRLVIPSLFLCTQFVHAQAPDPWAQLPVPAGTNQSGVTNLGKLVTHHAGTHVDVYSAFTRRWSSLPVGPGATTHQTNDWVIVQDSGTWTAFSAMRGRFAPLPVGPGAQMLNPIAQNNDSVLLVLDAGTLHAFSGFVGRWVSRPVGPGAQIAVQRHVGLLADGTTLGGYESFSGQWHDIAVGAPVSSLSTDGAAGIAVAGAVVHGFSAPRGSWSQAPAIASPTFQRGADWAVFRDGTQALGFSGLRGTFASTPIAPVQTTRFEDVFGVFRTSSTLHVYSAITGTWEALAAPAAALLRSAPGTAVLVEPLQLSAYSPTLGTFTVLSLDSSGDDLAGCVAAAVARSNNHPYLYSSMTGTWQAAPVDALPGLPSLAGTAALLPTATGFRAFSARTAAFVPLASVGGVAQTNTAAAPALVYDNASVHCFDARRDRWLSLPRNGTGQPTVGIWRTAALVLDGNDAIGFGTQSGTLARTTLPEPVLAWRANSESLGLTMQGHLAAFSALPVPTSLWQYPDFRRAFVTGAPFRLHVRLLPGDAAFFGGGLLAAAPQSFPGLGELLLDPASTHVQFVLPEVDADRAVMTIPVPDSPALRGASFWFQSLVLPSSGAPYLSDAATLFIG